MLHPARTYTLHQSTLINLNFTIPAHRNQPSHLHQFHLNSTHSIINQPSSQTHIQTCNYKLNSTNQPKQPSRSFTTIITILNPKPPFQSKPCPARCCALTLHPCHHHYITRSQAQKPKLAASLSSSESKHQVSAAENSKPPKIPNQRRRDQIEKQYSP
ncbi:hypothetical protein M0R45_016049 [Rubus argutus]|uniref:Uncharacterized protein n=1 Tax=Rubus argutus TaxID=59490 RepID=A0AAW1XRY4_RUBAR